MKKKKNHSTFSIILFILYVLSLIPILALSIYAYPQADDWSYSWRTHIAWADTHSFIAVLGAVWDTIADSYQNWQGTFSSIALMSLQPGIWHERFYMLVPFLFIGGLTFSTMFFFHELLHRMEDNTWLNLSLLTLLVTIQCMVCRPVAFYWYNGAVHYMAMYCFALLLITCLMKSLRASKHKPLWLAFSCLLSFILGGGNLVSGLSAVIGFVTALVLLTALHQKKARNLLLLPAVFNLAAFSINVAAPGNWLRQDATGENANPVMSVLRSFYYAIYYPGEVWFSWIIVLFVLLLLPIGWKIAKKHNFSYPCPLLVIAFSYCFLAAMYTPSDYAMQLVDVGRIQNMIFSAYILLLALNTLYMIGWIQKHFDISCKISFAFRKASVSFTQAYYAVMIMICIWMIGLTAIPSPESFTTTQAISELMNGSAQECGEIAAANIQILKESGNEATIRQIPHSSALLTSTDIDLWHYGAKYFYRKDTVNVIP